MSKNHCTALAIHNSYLNDDVINAFLDIVKLQTSFIPQNVLFYQTPLMYSAVENVDDFQILYDGSIGNDAIGHWLCVYYRNETKCVEVYDSLYHTLNDNLFEILDILYPSKSNVVFKSVIKQPDGYSCGVFAIEI
ncbi:unnamed protein product [Macrosiphum euphorbiae]|uniref:Ubiquitin-like protease family profile domain-containing protein n=1 Tax=Macrosiphum euphorbiae TaxID=13131 RepID=A0AAV0XBV9_9HEMI|nr:unnamed protein product [Macrosiphum euphorbiae]